MARLSITPEVDEEIGGIVAVLLPHLRRNPDLTVDGPTTLNQDGADVVFGMNLSAMSPRVVPAPVFRIYRGWPGSGKSTDARAWVAEDPTRRARVNRDTLRLMFHDGQHMGVEVEGQPARHTEDIVRAARDVLIAELLGLGISVACDDTNLPDANVEHLSSIAELYGATVAIVDLTGVPIEICIERDSRRPERERVGEEVIRRMYADRTSDPDRAAS